MKLQTRSFSLVLALIFWISACQKQENKATGIIKPSSKSDSTSNSNNKEKVENKSVLEIKCKEDSAITLQNDTSESDRHVKYELIDSIQFSDGYFVARHLYEGYDWIFISKASCSVTDLFGPIIFNPSKSYFASISNDNAAGFSENGVQIVSNNNWGTSIELQDKMKSYAGEIWSWTDDSTFTMKIVDLNGNNKQRTYSFREGTWLIKNE